MLYIATNNALSMQIRTELFPDMDTLLASAKEGFEAVEDRCNREKLFSHAKSSSQSPSSPSFLAAYNVRDSLGSLLSVLNYSVPARTIDLTVSTTLHYSIFRETPPTILVSEPIRLPTTIDFSFLKTFFYFFGMITGLHTSSICV